MGCGAGKQQDKSWQIPSVRKQPAPEVYEVSQIKLRVVCTYLASSLGLVCLSRAVGSTQTTATSVLGESLCIGHENVTAAFRPRLRSMCYAMIIHHQPEWQDSNSFEPPNIGSGSKFEFRIDMDSSSALFTVSYSTPCAPWRTLVTSLRHQSA